MGSQEPTDQSFPLPCRREPNEDVEQTSYTTKRQKRARCKYKLKPIPRAAKRHKGTEFESKCKSVLRRWLFEQVEPLPIEIPQPEQVQPEPTEPPQPEQPEQVEPLPTEPPLCTEQREEPNYSEWISLQPGRGIEMLVRMFETPGVFKLQKFFPNETKSKLLVRSSSLTDLWTFAQPDTVEKVAANSYGMPSENFIASIFSEPNHCILNMPSRAKLRDLELSLAITYHWNAIGVETCDFYRDLDNTVLKFNRKRPIACDVSCQTLLKLFKLLLPETSSDEEIETFRYLIDTMDKLSVEELLLDKNVHSSLADLVVNRFYFDEKSDSLLLTPDGSFDPSEGQQGYLRRCLLEQLPENYTLFERCMSFIAVTMMNSRDTFQPGISTRNPLNIDTAVKYGRYRFRDRSICFSPKAFLDLRSNLSILVHEMGHYIHHAIFKSTITRMPARPAIEAMVYNRQIVNLIAPSLIHPDRQALENQIAISFENYVGQNLDGFISAMELLAGSSRINHNIYCQSEDPRTGGQQLEDLAFFCIEAVMFAVQEGFIPWLFTVEGRFNEDLAQLFQEKPIHELLKSANTRKAVFDLLAKAIFIAGRFGFVKKDGRVYNRFADAEEMLTIYGFIATPDFFVWDRQNDESFDTRMLESRQDLYIPVMRSTYPHDLVKRDNFLFMTSALNLGSIGLWDPKFDKILYPALVMHDPAGAVIPFDRRKKYEITTAKQFAFDIIKNKDAELLRDVIAKQYIDLEADCVSSELLSRVIEVNDPDTTRALLEHPQFNFDNVDVHKVLYYALKKNPDVAMLMLEYPRLNFNLNLNFVFDIIKKKDSELLRDVLAEPSIDLRADGVSSDLISRAIEVNDPDTTRTLLECPQFKFDDVGMLKVFIDALTNSPHIAMLMLECPRINPNFNMDPNFNMSTISSFILGALPEDIFRKDAKQEATLVALKKWLVHPHLNLLNQDINIDTTFQCFLSILRDHHYLYVNYVLFLLKKCPKLAKSFDSARNFPRPPIGHRNWESFAESPFTDKFFKDALTEDNGDQTKNSVAEQLVFDLIQKGDSELLKDALAKPDLDLNADGVSSCLISRAIEVNDPDAIRTLLECHRFNFDDEGIMRVLYDALVPNPHVAMLMLECPRLNPNLNIEPKLNMSSMGPFILDVLHEAALYKDGKKQAILVALKKLLVHPRINFWNSNIDRTTFRDFLSILRTPNDLCINYIRFLLKRWPQLARLFDSAEDFPSPPIGHRNWESFVESPFTDKFFEDALAEYHGLETPTKNSDAEQLQKYEKAGKACMQLLGQDN
jgi:hypothetical protein